MHELSLVEAMMSSVAESAAENNITRVVRIKIVVGKLNLAQPELLRFAFNALQAGTVFEGATLEIEERPLVTRCQKCGNTCAPEYPAYFCSLCGGRVEVVTGQELYIEHYEGETGGDGDKDGAKGSDGPAAPEG